MQENQETSNSDPFSTQPTFATVEEYFAASESLASASRFEEAIDLLRKAVELFPDSAAATYNLGVALILKIRDDVARLELWEDNTDANSDTEEAIEALENAIALQPDMVPAYNNLGRLHALRGDAEHAIEAWRKSLEIDEFQPIIREELELYKNKIGPNPDDLEVQKEMRDGESDIQL